MPSGTFLGNLIVKDSVRLKKYIEAKVNDPEAVKEIFSQTLTSAYESQHRFLNKSSKYSWLIAIAKHEICDYYRKKKIKTFLFSRLPWLEEIATQALGPEQEYLKKELENRVACALNQIKKEYREVLKLKYVEDLSVKQIALKLNENVKTIESRLTRARTAFAKAYSADRL